MSPSDFMKRANDFIAARRFWQRGGVKLRLNVGAGGSVRASCETQRDEMQEAVMDVDGNMLLPEENAYLKIEEVLAVRLYTGPAYQPINVFLREVGHLRGKPRIAYARDRRHTFAATCKHICRAIRKLAAVATAEEVRAPLFRAVRGKLPESFWKADEGTPSSGKKIICATDTAFTSTSRARDIFEEYMPLGEDVQNVLWHLTPRAPSQIHRWRERGTIFCRGADISMLSQFAAEEEVLFPPCTMLIISPGDELRESVARTRRRAPGHRRAESDGAEPVVVAARREASFKASPSRSHALGSDADNESPFQVQERHEKGRAFIEVTAQPCFI
jgi:hypothetical protein